jgi:hypothetical protein
MRLSLPNECALEVGLDEPEPVRLADRRYPDAAAPAGAAWPSGD